MPVRGGSYLQDLMSAIAIGERCPTISLTLHNDEENEKRLSSAANSGQPIIAIDNFSGTLMGNFFCQLIERPMPQIRMLGKSEMVTIPNNHTVVANGINITIGTDAVRRGVRIELDPNMENPSERTFTRDPVAEVLANRGPAVAAVLTIARAYRVAGMPGKLTPRPELRGVVRQRAVRPGVAGLARLRRVSIKTARAADPHTQQAGRGDDRLGHRTESRRRLPHQRADQVRQAHTRARSDRVRPALWDALFAVAGTKQGQLDAAELGNWLRDHKNRIVAGHKLINDTADKSRPSWKLELR